MKFKEVEKALSIVLIRADGLDQAKHRCPRRLIQGHFFQRLLRPALHIQNLDVFIILIMICFICFVNCSLSRLVVFFIWLLDNLG